MMPQHPVECREQEEEARHVGHGLTATWPELRAEGSDQAQRDRLTRCAIKGARKQ